LRGGEPAYISTATDPRCPMSLVLTAAVAAATLAQGEIYGDLRLGEKYLADTKIVLTCGAERAEGTTDKAGSFRLAVKTPGKCQVTVTYEGQAASTDVVVFDKPSRYRLVLEQAGGKYVLKRV